MAGGQATPQILVEPFATAATACTPATAVAGGKTAPFPTPSQVATTPGAASLNDGFPAQTMTAPASGGVPPFGVDANGILFLLSGWIAFFGAGQWPQFSADLAEAMDGYAVGAIVQQEADTNNFWINTVSGNSSDPDTGTPGDAGWISTKPLYSSGNDLTSGDNNNLALPGPSDYIFDVSSAAGAATITGIVAQRDGQEVTFVKSDSSANAITFASLSSDSSAANQLRIPSAGIAIALQYQSVTFRYNATLTYWTQV